ncbi:MAG: MBL fold metallo-hydrolase [Gammaproteobacteria bacterium]|nr:MBL fold metallo-hydrolase [Gammaproteobacteria bacterium]
MRKLILVVLVAALGIWRFWPLPAAVIPPGEPLPAAQAPAGLRFALLKTGSATTLEAMVVAGGSLFRPTAIGHIAVLVEHPAGRFLFDSGLGTRIDAQFGSEMAIWAKPIFAYQNARPAVNQLRDAGIAPPPRIFLSHAHWDHASALSDFPQADIWVPAAEQDTALHGKPPAFLPSQFSSPDLRWHPYRFDGPAFAGYPASVDLFGDGSVVLLPLPGHTAGSTGLLLSLADGRRYFFVGDTVWNHRGIDQPAPKFSVSSLIVDADRDATWQAVLRLRALRDANPGLQIIPAHDSSVHDALGYFPQFVSAAAR